MPRFAANNWRCPFTRGILQTWGIFQSMILGFVPYNETLMNPPVLDTLGTASARHQNQSDHQSWTGPGSVRLGHWAEGTPNRYSPKKTSEKSAFVEKNTFFVGSTMLKKRLRSCRSLSNRFQAILEYGQNISSCAS